MRIAIVAATVFTCLGSVSLAHAQVSSTWTLASDYDFRGITQTARDPAIQASLDYAHGSGWYVGGWASNLDYCPSNAASCLDADYELDLYTGFTGTIGDEDTGWDAGFIYYTYEEPDYNYREIYGALSKGPFKLKVSYSDDFGGDTTPGATPAFYADGTVTIPLPYGLSALAHVGYSFGDYWDELDDAGAGCEYLDYSVGIGYAIRGSHLALRWIDGSDLKELDGTPDDVLSTERRVVFTIAATFP